MEIKANSTTLERIFYGLDVKYSVPKYQRDYSWTSSLELNELWNDIITAYRDQKEYFMGTLLLAKQEKENECYDIVDGQQRTVSFMLLLAVVQDYSKLVVDDDSSVQDLTVLSGSRSEYAEELYLLVRRHIKQGDHYYLRVTNKDAKYFEFALDILNRNKKLEINNRINRIIKAKSFFQEKIRSEFFGKTDSLIELMKFFKYVITKLKFVTITVEDDFDAYIIFESLNSKGLDLSVSDLLKNKILSNVSTDYQDAALLEWDDIVKKIQNTSSGFVDFIKIYWAAYVNPEITKANLYKEIRKYIGRKESSTKELLDSLSKNADTFIKIKNKSDSNWPKISSKEPWAETIAEINLLGYTIHLPCLLYALHNREDVVEKLSKYSLIVLFKWITICDNGIGEIDSLFKNVLKDLKSGKEFSIIEERFKDLLKKLAPTFSESISSYETESSTILKYISCKIHMHRKNKFQIPNYLEVDLEHILPKSLEKWEAVPGFDSDFSKPYSRWINNIGNVILLEKGKNRKIKNSPFCEKTKVYNDSDFEDARLISAMDSWNECEIKKRAKIISDIAAEIWKE